MVHVSHFWGVFSTELSCQFDQDLISDEIRTDLFRTFGRNFLIRLNIHLSKGQSFLSLVLS